jgi:hypothetical protein
MRENDSIGSGDALQTGEDCLRFRRVWLENYCMALEFTTSFLKDSIEVLRYYKRLAERAMAQIPDEALFAAVDSQSNSVAIIVKHLAGNMRSRFTDFLTSDGEKPDRKRDSEFEAPPTTRAELMEMWEAGWRRVFDAITPLTDPQLNDKVYIRSEAHSVMQAVNRQLVHYAYHIGQIVYVSKHFAGANWNSLTIPKGKSEDFTSRVASGRASQR